MKGFKDFFKKKEAEWKFKTGTMSGGHKLSDGPSGQNTSRASSNSSGYVQPERKTGPDRNVAEAALARLQGGNASSTQRSQGQNLGHKSTLHDLINEEKKQIQEEARIKDQLEVCVFVFFLTLSLSFFVLF